jgi:hypothetical protein
MRDLSSGRFEDDHNWNIVGYGEIGEKTNWETDRPMVDADINWITEVVVEVPREGQEPDFFTLHGPWDDWQDLEDHIDDEEDHYGQAA